MVSTGVDLSILIEPGKGSVHDCRKLEGKA